MSTPILNAPQSGILGMHKIQPRPVADGDKVLPGSMSLGGKTIEPTVTYRVTVPDISADSVVLKDGTDRMTKMPDIEASEAYFRANSPISPHPLGRIRRVN
jgi:5'-nucleotidase